MYNSIILTGGGSAGHTVPHLALLPSFKTIFKEVHYIGTNGIEKEIMSGTGVIFHEISAVKLKRNICAENLKIPFEVFKSIKQADAIIKDINADIVFSKGGYVAFPVVKAAAKNKIPIISHESDLTAGLANKMCSRYCKTVYTSFKETAKHIKNGAYSGPPIREELLFKNITKNKLKKKKNLLIIGGGSGSAVINDCVEKCLDFLCGKYNVTHICGQNFKQISRDGYTQISYTNNIFEILKNSDLCISRAGSNTLFELAFLRIPALVIPIPKGVSRGDQIQNAEYFKNKGFCKVLQQSDLNPQNLIRSLLLLDGDKKIESALNCASIEPANTIILSGIRETLSKNYLS